MNLRMGEYDLKKLFLLNMCLYAVFSWARFINNTKEHAVIFAINIFIIMLYYIKNKNIRINASKEYMILIIFISFEIFYDIFFIGYPKGIARSIFYMSCILSATYALNRDSDYEYIFRNFSIFFFMFILFDMMFYIHASYFLGPRLSLGWNQNVLGMLSLLALLGAIWLPSKIGWLFMAFFAALIFLSGCRSAMLAMAVVLLVQGWNWRRNGWRLPHLVLILGAVMLFAGLGFALANADAVIARISNLHNITTRFWVYENALHVWKTSPWFGVGLGMHGTYLENPERYGITLPHPFVAGGVRFAHAHSVYFATLMETGILGLAVFLFLLIRGLWLLYRDGTGNGNRTSQACFLILLSYAVIGLSESLFIQPGRVLWLFAIICLTRAFRLPERREMPDAAARLAEE